MPLRYITGRLLYKKKSTDSVRGREDFSITENRDGTLTMETLAVTDDSKFVRHVVYTKGADGRPRDAFVRLQVDGALVGSGYFRVQGDTLHVTTDTNMTGHTARRASSGRQDSFRPPALSRSTRLVDGRLFRPLFDGVTPWRTW